MKMLQSLKNELIKMEISSGKILNGVIVDISSEIIVIYNGEKFVYVPIEHIQSFEIDVENEENIQQPTETPSIDSHDDTEMTTLTILSKAQGIDVEIFVTGNKSLRGTITAIMSDYFVFKSPVYKTIFIPNKHLKWLIPYTGSDNLLPYGLTKEELSNSISNSQTYKNTFDLLIEQLINKLVVINLGEKQNQIGKIKNVNKNIFELILADSRSIYVNSSHVKTIYSV